MIQTDMYAEFGFRRLVDAVKDLNLSYSIFKLRPFDHHIEIVDGLIPGGAKPTMVWGMTTIEEVAKRYGWVPGVFKNENFDMRVFHKMWGTEMLNFDGQFHKLGEVPSFEGARFIRPVHDTKSFTGQLINGDEFEKWRQQLYELRHEYTTLDLNTEVMVATPKKLVNEARFFVVDKEVISGSTYRVGGRVLYKHIDRNFPLGIPLLEYAERHCVASTSELMPWTPAEAFVLDVGQTDEGKLKIIEVNCLNTSGFYDNDMTAVVKAISYMKSWPDTWAGTPWFEERYQKAVEDWKKKLEAMGA